MAPFSLQHTLRLGRLDTPVEEPLLVGIEDLPYVDVQRFDTSALVEAFAAGALDAAVLPPLAAFRLSDVHIVPGVALCAHEVETLPRIYFTDTPENIRTVWIGDDPWQCGEVLALVLAHLSGGMPRVVPVAEAAEEWAQTPSALLSSTSSPECKVETNPRVADSHDFLPFFQRVCETPLPLRIWVCRIRTPHASVRYCAAFCRRRALETAGQRYNDNTTCAPLSVPKYFLGQEAAQTLRWLFRCAAAQGLSARGGDLTFC